MFFLDEHKIFFILYELNIRPTSKKGYNKRNFYFPLVDKIKTPDPWKTFKLNTWLQNTFDFSRPQFYPELKE